jgi:hypothetical protein
MLFVIHEILEYVLAQSSFEGPGSVVYLLESTHQAALEKPKPYDRFVTKSLDNGLLSSLAFL